jgi:hypothetical protein
MSYEDKALAPRLAERAPEPWDTNRHGAPDPAWPVEDQLLWFSRYSHVLLLNASERCRTSAAAEADKELARRRAVPA